MLKIINSKTQDAEVLEGGKNSCLFQFHTSIGLLKA